MHEALVAFPGEFTDGRSAELHAYTVRILGDHLQIHDQRQNQRLPDWPKATTTIDTSYHGQIRLIDSAHPGAAIVVSDPAFAQALAAAGWMRQPMERWKLLLGLASLLAACCIGLYAAINPLSYAITSKIPASFEAKLRDELRPAIQEDQCSDPAADALLQGLVTRLKGKDSRVYEVLIVHDDDVNAYAIPGGLILVNSGFLEKADSADELAGVLAHEMEHVNRLHAMSALVRALILTGAWQLVIGDFSGLLIADPSTLFHMMSLKFNRDMEAEADAGALIRLDRARISRSGFADFFRRMDKKRGDNPALEFLSSHPSHEKRLEKTLAKKSAKHLRPALGPRDWLRLQAACAAKGAAAP
jgi:Zn-dependent protease with chaperone function